MLDLLQIKRSSEAAIQAAGGEVLATLPHIDLEEIHVRTSPAIAERALVLNVMVNLSFGAPPSVGNQWLESQGLQGAITAEEKLCLQAKHIDEATRNKLRWNIESLWAAAWVGNMVEDLSPAQAISETLASLFPDLRTNESPNAFFREFRLRSVDKLYSKLDLFYRSHWYARNCHLSGKDPTPFNLGVVQYRRHLLEWATHATVDWSDVDLST